MKHYLKFVLIIVCDDSLTFEKNRLDLHTIFMYHILSVLSLCQLLVKPHALLYNFL
jgi:hypothetical protein